MVLGVRRVRRGKVRDDFAQGGVHSLANNRPCTVTNVPFDASAMIWNGWSGWEAQLPRVIQRQRWSPVNVPLMWGAAGEEQTIPVLDWLFAAETDMDGAVEFITAQFAQWTP